MNIDLWLVGPEGDCCPPIRHDWDEIFHSDHYGLDLRSNVVLKWKLYRDVSPRWVEARSDDGAVVARIPLNDRPDLKAHQTFVAETNVDLML